MTGCRTARTPTNDNTAARQVIAAAQQELRDTGQADDMATVAHLLAWRLIAALREVSAGHVRAAPMREIAGPRVRPVALGSEMEEQ